LPSGLFQLAAVEKWIQERDEKKSARSGLKDEKLAGEIEKIRRDIKLRDLEIAKSEGKLHDKALCAQSVTEMRARESHVLHGLASRFRAAYPEAEAQSVWIEREIDGLIERLRSGDSVGA